MLSGVCKLCGCTDDNACPGGCAWLDKARTICSACVRKMDDADLIQLAASDMARERIEFTMSFDAPSMLTLAGILGLLRRHPDFWSNAKASALAERLLDAIRQCLDWSPVCVEIIRRGDDPGHDMTLEGTARPAGVVLPHL